MFKSKRKILTTYKGFCNSFCTVQNSAVPAVFVGSLNGRKKVELQDIAYALRLEIEGRVEDLKSRINAYFNDNEEQCTSPRYIGLFPQLTRQARRAVGALATTSTYFASTPALCDVTNTTLHH
jgi:hypothetical protein